jgi:hypothetical protein
MLELGGCCIVSHDLGLDLFQQDHSVFTEQVVISSGSSSSSSYRHSEDGVPAPNLRFLEDKVKKDLVRRISRIERLGISFSNGKKYCGATPPFLDCGGAPLPRGVSHPNN